MAGESDLGAPLVRSPRVLFAIRTLGWTALVLTLSTKFPRVRYLVTSPQHFLTSLPSPLPLVKESWKRPGPGTTEVRKTSLLAASREGCPPKQQVEVLRTLQTSGFYLVTPRHILHTCLPEASSPALTTYITNVLLSPWVKPPPPPRNIPPINRTATASLLCVKCPIRKLQTNVLWSVLGRKLRRQQNVLLLSRTIDTRRTGETSLSGAKRL